jgi:FHA domain
MARLVIRPGSPGAWEVTLKTGANSLGRNPSNDVKLDDPSVSGSHCEIRLENEHAAIKDLGSTNGTFVNGAPVSEAALGPGHTIHLGSLEMLFCSDAPVSAGGAQAAAAPRVAPIAPPLPPPRAAAPAGVARGRPTMAVSLTPNRQAPFTVQSPMPIAAPPVVVAPSGAVGSGPCKHHPQIPGRHFCDQCQLFFCDVCVTTHGQQKFCRHCGTECAQVKVQLQRPTAPKGFFARIPSAFIYPFRGSGLLVLILCAFLLAGLDFISKGWFFILSFLFFGLKIVAYGYLFSYMQNIIHATASEEDEMPEMPGFDNVFGGAFRFGVTVLISFALPIAFSVLQILSVLGFLGPVHAPDGALVTTMVLGYLYFPMAFLAVAMKDTVLAANPLVVIPAILKVPLGYLVTAILVIGIYVLRQSGNWAVGHTTGAGAHTRDVSVMLLTFGVRAVWTLVSFYLLTVSARILGLLYVTNKQKLGWFDR